MHNIQIIEWRDAPQNKQFTDEYQTKSHSKSVLLYWYISQIQKAVDVRLAEKNLAYKYQVTS